MISDFWKWCIFVLVVFVPGMMFIDRIYPDYVFPVWALFTITTLLIVGPVSPSLVSGRNIFQKSFKISDQG